VATNNRCTVFCWRADKPRPTPPRPFVAWAALAALSLSVGGSGSEAWGQCLGFPVQTNQKCTNSGSLQNTSLDGFENVGLQDFGTLTVTNASSGVISATGPSSLAVKALNATVSNYGTILATGGGSLGIVANVNATVTNYGSILGIGTSAFGVYATNTTVKTLAERTVGHEADAEFIASIECRTCRRRPISLGCNFGSCTRALNVTSIRSSPTWPNSDRAGS
jgi:hypothetical protein